MKSLLHIILGAMSHGAWYTKLNVLIKFLRFKCKDIEMRHTLIVQLQFLLLFVKKVFTINIIKYGPYIIVACLEAIILPFLVDPCDWITHIVQGYLSGPEAIIGFLQRLSKCLKDMGKLWWYLVTTTHNSVRMSFELWKWYKINTKLSIYIYKYLIYIYININTVISLPMVSCFHSSGKCYKARKKSTLNLRIVVNRKNANAFWIADQ